MVTARVGDTISVAGRAHNPTGRIVGVYSAVGAPPYLVRWCDDHRETLFVPGSQDEVCRSPDAPSSAAGL